MKTKKKFHPLRSLLITQFFGAFNDNAWKLAVTFLGIRALSSSFQGSSIEFQEASQFQTTLTFSALTIPLMLFSLPAGVLADRMSKRVVMIYMKGLEVILMAVGAICLYVAPSNTTALLVVLGLMGAQSALFSPAKYGILPELLDHKELSSGNALLQLWTFLAIILGTASGGFLLDASGHNLWMVSAFLTVLALIGFVASFGIPKVPAARSEGQLVASMKMAWLAMRADRVLWLGVVGSVFYWFLASLLGQNVLVYAKSLLRLSDTFSGVPLALFGIGVGVGSMLAGKLSRGKVEYGLLPLGALGMTLASLFLGLLVPKLYGLLFLMTVIGVSSGFLIVPLSAILQWRSPQDRRGAVIALSNIFVFAGVFVGSISVTLFAKAGFGPDKIFVAASIMLVAGSVWAVRLLPDALLRLLLVILTFSLYRLKIIDRENLPEEGGVLLVPNHVSFVDALMILASVDRPVRFLADRRYFNNPFLKPFMKSLGVIPISNSEGPRVILKAFREAGENLDRGEVVCIFPEGQITRTGTLLPFRRGMEKILKGRNPQIVPMYLDRLWGSIFSREGGRFLTKLPKRIPYHVTVAFGAPRPAQTPLHEIRHDVQDLSAKAWKTRKSDVRPLHHEFIRKARSAPFALCFADALKPKVSRFGALTGSVVLARALRKGWKSQANVGILLPPSVAGALVNLAATITGRTTVNLNYTVGKEGLLSAMKQANIQSVVTSRLFLKKAEVELPEETKTIWMEDLVRSIGGGEKILSSLAAFFLPTRWLEKFAGAIRVPQVDDLATIIFSSGSTGEPKGVMLTHFNIESNVEGIAQVLRVERKDRVLGILPFFHSFGYMSFWFAAKQGLVMPLHANPLDAQAVGELVHKHLVTLLLATPTFLQLYLKRCTPEQFGSLRLVLTGAEKLSDRLVVSFDDRFGIRPIEGYGTTECSPVIAASVPDFRGPGIYQVGSRRGFVGQPLPGVVPKIVDPDTYQSLDPGESGMLKVKGPNVMKGYLGQEDLTQEVVQDGWYITGDIALIDEDGFIRITDRLSRFSKIGGEMVPHLKIEEALHQAIASDTQVFAVTSVKDERKGESLAVVHTYDEAKIPEVLDQLGGLGLPNLFIPRKDRFIKVDAIPILGTGKLDLKGVKKLAVARFESSDD